MSSFLFAEKVGHKGLVVGIDEDDAIIELAEQRRTTHYLRDRIKFKKMKAINCSITSKFDFIIMFNSLSYISNPIQLLTKIPRYLNHQGSLFVKDSDIGSDFFWPVDIDLYYRLMSTIQKATQIRLDGYDPFFARKIPRLLGKANYKILNIFSQSFSFCYPVDPQERMYISTNAMMIGKQAVAAGDIKGAGQWGKQFEEDQSSCIFNKQEFFYSMTEFLFHAQVPTNS